MLCVFGEEEPVSGCRDAPAGLLRKDMRKGGHHFDGDFDALMKDVIEFLGITETQTPRS
jgi:type IV secretory pathway VirJ component